MQPQDKPEFARIITGLATIKPGKPLTGDGLDMFWLAMQAWTIEDFRSAAAHLAQSCEFMPNPYHFEQLRKAGRQTAAEAFDRAVRHAASSAYRNGPLGDPAIDAAVRGLGGYTVIAMCETDKLPFIERRFVEHYETVRDAEDVRQALPAIAGPSATTLRLLRSIP